MDLDNLINTVNLILTIAFWGIIGSIVIYFLVGLLRGWKHGTWRFIFMLAVLITLLALLPVWTEIVGNLDLASMGVPAISFTINGKNLTVQPTTVFQTVETAVFKALKEGYEVKASIETITNYSIAFASSAIRLVLVAVIALVTMVLGALLSFIFWHLIVKHFIAKERRKPKLRIVSSLEEVTLGVLCLVLLITPFSAIANAFHGYVDPKTLPEENQTVQLYKRVAETYDQSILNQAFFAWTKGDGKVSLDVQLGEFLASADFKNATSNLITEIRAFGSTGGGLLGLMADAQDPQNVTSSLMLSPVAFAGNLAANLLTMSGDQGMNVLSDLSRFAVDVSSRYDDVVATLGQETIGRLSSPKLRGQSYVQEGRQAYDRLIASGFVETEIRNWDSIIGIPVNDNPYYALTSKTTLDAIEAIASSASSSSVVDSLLHGYLSSRSEATGIKALMPVNDSDEVEEDKFASMSYLHEAKTIVSTFHRLNELDADFAKLTIDTIKKADSSGSATPQDVAKLVNELLALFGRKSDEFIELFVGPRDKQGEPVANAEGISVKGCLFDSGLVNAVFPIAVEIAASAIGENVLKNPSAIDVGDVAIALQGTKTSENILNDKREFGHILDVVGEMVHNPYEGSGDQAKLAQGEKIAQSAKDLLSNLKAHKGIELDPEGNLYSYETTLMQAVANGIVNVDQSMIFTAMMPPIAENLLSQNKSLLGEFDINTLNTRPVDSKGNSILGWELGKVLAIGFRCPNIFPIFLRSGGYSVDSIARAMNEHAEEFLTVLDILTDSQVLNPDVLKVDGDYVVDSPEAKAAHPSAPTVHNLNFVKILNYLFHSMKMDTVLNDEDLSDESKVILTSEYVPTDNIVDFMAEIKTTHENGAIIEATHRVLASGLLDALTDIASTRNLLIALGNCDIRGIFNALGDSYVLRHIMPEYLDKNILESVFNVGGQTTDLKAYGITFYNIGEDQESWDKEGEYFDTLIQLASKGIDLSNFDPLKDGEALVEIMSALSSSKMFQPIEVKDGESVRTFVFPQFFADKILAAMGDNLHYFEDRNVDPAETDKAKRCSSFVTACKQLNTPEKWKIENDGEFKKLRKVFQDLSKIGSFDRLNTLDSSTIPLLRFTLEDMAHTYTFSTVFLGNALENALKNIDAGTLDFKAAYTAYFFDDQRDAPGYNREGKANEMEGQVDELFTIMELIYDDTYGMAKEGGSGLDFSKINIKTVSTAYFIDPLLTAAKNSAVFHPSKELIGQAAYTEYRAAHPYTVFEQIMGQFIMNAKVYKLQEGSTWENSLRDSGYPCDTSIAGIVTGVENAEWDNEIDTLCAIVEELKVSSFVDDQGNMDFSALSNLSQFFGDTANKQEAQRQWLISFLDSIDESTLLRRALPKLLSDAIDELQFDMADDLRCVNYYFSNQAGTDYGKLGHTEIEYLATIFKDIAGLQNMNPDDISSLDGEALADALVTMEQSKIFHSDVTKSVTIFSDKPAKQGYTAFEELLGDIISNKALADYLYYANSPKDSYYTGQGTYSDAVSKALYLVRLNCAEPIGATPATKSGAEEITKFGEFIEYLGSESVAPYMQGGVPKFDEMDTETLSSILRQVNDSAFFRDIVATALDKTVNDPSSSMKVDGVDLTTADFYYMYEEAPVGATPDQVYARGYEQSEIDQICFIMETLKENKDSMSNLKISTVDPMMLRYLLLDLSNSKVFHTGGARSDSIITPIAWGYDNTKNEVIEANDLTVFEQFMKKFYIASTIHKNNFSLTQSEADLQLYLDTDEGGRLAFLPNSLTQEAHIEAAAVYKMHQNIKSFSAAEKVASYPVLKGNPIKTSWLSEISAITSDGHFHDPKIIDKVVDDTFTHEQDAYVGLVQAVQKLDMFDAEGNLDLSGDFLNRTEPNKVFYLYSALNRCTLINEGVVNTFATYLSGKGAPAGEGLGIEGYSSTTYPIDGTPNALTFDSEALATKSLYQGQTIDRKAMPSYARFGYAYTGKVSTDDVVNHYADHFAVTYQGKDVTDLVSASAEGDVITLNVTKIPGTLTITAKDADGKFSSAEFIYDLADYRLSQEEYEAKAIPAVYYFLTSLFRGRLGTGDQSYYYSFDNSSLMFDFLNDPECAPGFQHSTFGLFYILMGAGIFDNLDATQSYSIRDYALVHLLEVKMDVMGNEYTFNMGAEFHQTLGLTDITGSSIGLHQITKDYDETAEVLDLCFHEASYLDQYIVEIGFADILANFIYWTQLRNELLPPIGRIGLLKTFESTLYGNTASVTYQQMDSFASSTVYAAPKAIKLYGTVAGAENANFTSVSPDYTNPGPMCSKIITSVIRKFAGTYNSLALMNHTTACPAASLPTSAYPGTMLATRSAHMTASGYTGDTKVWDALTPEAVLASEEGKLNAMGAFKQMLILANGIATSRKATVAGALAQFGSLTEGAKILLEQFYMGNLYDYLAGGMDTSIMNPNALHVFNSNNVYYDFNEAVNKLGGADKAFSYQDIATLLGA